MLDLRHYGHQRPTSVWCKVIAGLNRLWTGCPRHYRLHILFQVVPDSKSDCLVVYIIPDRKSCCMVDLIYVLLEQRFKWSLTLSWARLLVVHLAFGEFLPFCWLTEMSFWCENWSKSSSPFFIFILPSRAYCKLLCLIHSERYGDKLSFLHLS